MSLPSSVTASAPGKLILMGEHAVVYGHPALVAAADRRLSARLAAGPRSGRVELALPLLGHRETTSWAEVLAYARAARERWRRYDAAPGRAGYDALRGEEPAHLAKVALGEAAAYLGEGGAGPGERRPGLRVEVESELPIGSGFGSSAALAVALVGGYLALRTGADPDPGELERLAMEVERRQHGSPSGVDAATVLHGGLVWAERAGAGAARGPEPGGRGAGGEKRAPGDAGSGRRGRGSLSVTPLSRTPAHLSRFRVFDTGTPAESTGAVVAAVRERVESRPELARTLAGMGRATRRFRALLFGEGSSPFSLVLPIREYEAGLEALGVVPDAARALVRAAEAAGGAGKVSGAGALTAGAGRPRAGSLLLYHPGPEWPEAAVPRGMPEVRVVLGGPGFRWEAA